MISPDRMQQLADGTEELMGKPTIIDGADVSGCEFFEFWEKQFNREYGCMIKIKEHKICKNKKDCYYKQLQRLKEINKPLEDEYFKGLDIKTIAELAKKSIRLSKENRELEEENEDLKIRHKRLRDFIKELKAEIEKLKAELGRYEI